MPIALGMITAASFAVVPAGTLAQSFGDGLPSVSQDAKLLLSANELIYNQDTNTIIAQGGVQIDYDGNRMVAERIEYDQASGRLKAIGNIEFLQPDGTKIFADKLDVTDDFADGFINTLLVETTDNTRIAAESAERINGTQTRFNNGIYTACEPCEDHPDRPPLWQIRAERVVQDGETETIRLRNARFELFGMPIAVLPYLEIPAHTTKQATGFLFPQVSFAERLGASLSVPYHIVFSPHMDTTITGTGYTRQGFLGEAEFRRRFHNGNLTLRMAGIHQLSQGAFTAGTSDAQASSRGMIATSGNFQINPRWTFGWDVLAQTDNNFARTYALEGYDAEEQKSQIYLTGLGSRNYFDLRAFRFDIQNADPNELLERQQAFVHPSLDYNYILKDPVAGGTLSLDVNATSLSRGASSTNAGRFDGLSGVSNRLTAEIEWKKRWIAPGGLAVTPLFAARGDAHHVDVSAATGYAGTQQANGTSGRYMATAGLEVSYPLLAKTPNSSHVFEPIAQIFVRPDEQLSGGLPNEDAQSFVFDATTLFERDKFSGYDRIEGGTRANIGFRYTGTFDNGLKVNGIFGQSYHLAGLNSFATADLVNAGAESGLETRVSDFVGQVGISTPAGISLTAGGRFDERDFSTRRIDIGAALNRGPISAALNYSQIAAQPTYGSTSKREELQAQTRVQLNENWAVSANGTYDFSNKLTRGYGAGLHYGDECFIFDLNYQNTSNSANGGANDWSVKAKLSIRTLGDINLGSSGSF